LMPTRISSRSSPGSTTCRQRSRGIDSTRSSPPHWQAARPARAAVDQYGRARWPPEVTGAGLPSSSRTYQTVPWRATSRKNTAACAQLWLIDCQRSNCAASGPGRGFPPRRRRRAGRLTAGPFAVPAPRSGALDLRRDLIGSDQPPDRCRVPGHACPLASHQMLDEILFGPVGLAG
jgi:hypothetical protein